VAGMTTCLHLAYTTSNKLRTSPTFSKKWVFLSAARVSHVMLWGIISHCFNENFRTTYIENIHKLINHTNQSSDTSKLHKRTTHISFGPSPQSTLCTPTEYTYLTHNTLFVLLKLDVHWLLTIWDLMFSMCN
jgi:hypothetical protein